MSGRFGDMSGAERLMLRKAVVDEMQARVVWPVRQSVKYMRTTLRLTPDELARLAGLDVLEVTDFECGASDSMRVAESLLGVLGMKLGVVRRPR